MARTREPLLEKAIKEGRKAKPYPLRNETGIPDICVQYCEDKGAEYPVHAPNTYSVTSLKKSYKEYLFNKFLADEAGRDVQDLFPSADGTAVHDALQLTALKRPERYIPEERINVVFVNAFVDELGRHIEDLTLSGEYDCYDKKESQLNDYKNTKQSVIDKNFSGRSNEIELQLSLYSWLFKWKYHFYPKKHAIIARAKDHSKVKQMAMNSDKHACQVKNYEITDALRKHYVEFAKDKMVNMYLMEHGLMAVPDCTPEETWREDAFIVSKPVDMDALSKGDGYKPPKAMKVCETYDDARAWFLTNNGTGKGYRIYRRYSEPIKCRFYCQFRDICNQYKEKESTHPAFYEDVTDGDMPF